MTVFVSVWGIAWVSAFWKEYQVVLRATAHAVVAVGFYWEEKTMFLCSSDITIYSESLGKWPWKKSGGDRVEIGYRWKSPISSSW